MTLNFAGRAAWVKSLHKLAELGIHFACVGTVRDVTPAGVTYYIVQGYHDIVERLEETADFFEGDDWVRIP